MAKLNKNVPGKITGLGWGNGLAIFFGGGWVITGLEDRSLLALGLPFLSLGIYLLFRKQKKENLLREKLLNELAIHKTFSTILEEHLKESIDALNKQFEKGELNIDIIELSDFQDKFDAISEKEEEAIIVEEKIEKELNDKTALLSSLSNKATALSERAKMLAQA